MNITETKDYLKLAAKRGARLGLDRVQALVHRLGDPQKQISVIHISGTNGKGSVGAMLAAILSASGIRTGHFATPAILDINDYFRICGKTASDEQIAETLTAVRAEAEQMADLPTEFEILAAAAYLLFANEKCEIAVIECCMGGDTDCTNVIEQPLLSVITNVRKDHTGFLGNTLAEIAQHKAGIIKKGRPVLCGCRNPETVSVIRRYAEEKHAPFFSRITRITGISAHLNGTDLFAAPFGTVHLSLLGLYQPDNAALVLDAVRLLRRLGVNLPNDAVRAGLAACHWHGRFELLCDAPTVLFDGAHNPDGMRIAAKSLAHYFGTDRPLVFVTGVMADKEYTEYPALLHDLAYKIYTVQPDNPRALSAEALARVYTDAGIPAAACGSTADALRQALGEGRPVMGLGSLYLYREFYRAFRGIVG